MPPEETTVTVTDQESPAESAADIEAAQAAASAATAAEAAAAALVMADAAAAQVTDNASVEIAEYQERLATCEAQLERVIQSQTDSFQAWDRHREETERRLAEAAEMLSSIQSRLAPEPAPPPNQPQDQSGAEPTEAAEEAPPPAEPSPARRRAHRWI